MRAQRENFLKGGDWLKDGGQILGGGQVARGGGESAEALCPPPSPPEMETLYSIISYRFSWNLL